MVGQKLSAIRKKYEISEHNFGKIVMESRDQARKIKVECFRAIWSVAEHFKVTGGRWCCLAADTNINAMWTRIVRFLHQVL